MGHIKTFLRVKPSKNPCKYFVTTDQSIRVSLPESFFSNKFNKSQHQRIISHEFQYDGVFGSDALQDQIFEAVAMPVVERFLQGYNGTIFAYGQTGSGKTYTVDGSQKYYQERGIIPRILSAIYNNINQRDSKDISIHVTYMEIYKEVGYDLLNPATKAGSMIIELPRVS